MPNFDYLHYNIGGSLVHNASTLRGKRYLNSAFPFIGYLRPPFVAMQLITMPTPLRLLALAQFLNQVEVLAQVGGPSSICDGTVTVTWVPPPFTLTVYTSGTYNASDATSITSPSSGAGSQSNEFSTGLGLGSQTLPLSPQATLSVPSVSAPTVVPTTVVPTIDPNVNPIPSTVSSTLMSSASAGDGTGSSPRSSSPTLDVPSSLLPGLPTSESASLPVTQVSVSSPQVSVTSPQVSASSPTLSLPSTTPLVPISSLLNVLSTSASSATGSLSFTTTTRTQSLTTSFQNSQPQLPSSLTLSIPGGSSGLSIPSVTLTGLSTSMSSVSVPIDSFGTSSRGYQGLTTTFSTRSTSSRTSATPTIPTASVLALISCPDDDGLNYLAPGGKAFQLECNRERRGSVMSQNAQPDLESCIDACDAMQECRAVSYDTTSSICSYKSDVSFEAIQDNTIMSASPIDLSCPGADGASYMDRAGAFYQVLCDYSFPDSNIINSIPADDYSSCSDDCSEVAECTGFSYTEGTCTFYRGFGSTGSARRGTNTVVLLAKRAVIANPDGSTMTSTSSASTLPPYSVSKSMPLVTGSRVSTTTSSSSTGISASISLSLPITNIASLTTTSLDGSITLPTSITVPSSPSIPSLSATSISAYIPDVYSTDPTLTSLPTVSPSLSNLPTSSSVSVSVDVPSLSTTLSISLTTLSIDTISLSSPIMSSISISSISAYITNPLGSLSSATLPTSFGPTQTPVAYTCPEQDGDVVIENGASYVLSCNSTTDGQSYSSEVAADSFNDCFRECDQSSAQGGANYCTAFTYEGSENGDGPGACYLYNGVAQDFVPSTPGRTYITAIRTVNYAPGAAGGGASSVFSTLPTLTTLPSITTLPSSTTSLPTSLPTSLTSLTISPSISLPSVSISDPLNLSGSSSTASIPLSTSLSSIDLLTTSLPTLSTSLSVPPVTGTCTNGGDILNACILATPGVGIAGGVGVVGPSNSTILDVRVSATLGVSLSVQAGAGVGVSLGSSGLDLSLSGTLGVGAGVTGGLGGGLGGIGSALGLGGAAKTSSSATPSATPGAGSPSSSSSLPTSTTSFYVTPLGPVVTTTTTSSFTPSTTTVYTTSTVTSCLTGLGGILTCPLGGLFTTLPSTSGDVTSISTSTSTHTSISTSISTSTSISISYITVTVSSTSSSSSSIANQATISSTLATITTTTTTTTSSSSSRTSSASTSSATCRLLSVAGRCILF